MCNVSSFDQLAGGAALGVGIWIVIDEDSFFNTLYPHLLDVSTIDKEFLRHAAIVLATGGAGTVFFALLGIAAAVTSSTCLLGLVRVIRDHMICYMVSGVIKLWILGLKDPKITAVQSDLISS